jgi:hypothetical protein
VECVPHPVFLLPGGIAESTRTQVKLLLRLNMNNTLVLVKLLMYYVLLILCTIYLLET